MAITDRLRKDFQKTTTTKTASELEAPPSVEESVEEVLDNEIELYSALMFWYGMSLPEILETPANILRKLIQKLPKHLADFQRMLIVGGSFAYMDKKDQQQIHRQLDNAGESEARSDPKAVDLKELSPVGRKHYFASRGISFEEAPSSNGHGG